MASLTRTASILDENLEDVPEISMREAEVLEEEILESKVASLLSSVKEKPEDISVDVSDSIIENTSGRNIDELYEEILFETLNNIGCPSSQETSPDSLLEFMRDAFKIPREKHDELLDVAKAKEPPKIRLNVEVIKAENLMPKDYNGLSDPFVTIYIESNAVHRYNTSVKSTTLNPVWNEYFSLPIPEDPNREILIIEVWDFDAAETVGEKVNKFFEVKGVKGLRKLMKEIAYSASTTVKDDNELVGRTEVPLSSIPASGMRVWYQLEKKSRTNRSRGSVLVHLCFSAEKDSRVAAQEHRNLLRILLMHELEYSVPEPYQWNGTYGTQAEAIITQHYIQSGLSEIDLALCQWDAYAYVHEHHPLSFSLFNTLIHKIIETLPTYSLDSDFVKIFWQASKRILPSCFYIIRKARQETFSQKLGINMLCDVLEILQIFNLLTIPSDVNLFPPSMYAWIKNLDNEVDELNINFILTETILVGARDWVNTIKESCELDNEDNLQQLTKLIQLMRFDVQRAIDFHQKHFYQIMKINYVKLIYECYQRNIVESCEPVILDACNNLVQLPDGSLNNIEQFENIDDFTMGTHLFELYLSLKRFVALGTALYTKEDHPELLVYHEWFEPAVTHWLNMSLLKALTRINKAIQLDEFIPVDGNVRHSSSALDTLSIFYQIKIFWEQLDWPNVEGSFAFIGKIVDDVCKCCAFYAQTIAFKIEQFHSVQNEENLEEFLITKEWCTSISNISHIKKNLPTYVKDLGVDVVLEGLRESLSTVEADRCAETIKNVIENSVDTVQNRIADLIAEAANKMIPVMRGYLFNGIDNLNEDLVSMEGLFVYFEKSLSILHAELDEEYFERMIDNIWQGFSSVFYELVQNNLDKRRAPSFFVHLREVIRIMSSSFSYGNTSEITSETLATIQKLLNTHASETDVLIHEYYKERYRRQKEKPQSVYGQLTIKAFFTENNYLYVHVLNAKNLLPMDSNNSCDSFVKLHYIPLNRFPGIPTQKTSVQSKTLFPLYDEEFKVQLTSNHRENGDNMLVFSIKDRDMFGMSNQYLAECYLSFENIEAAGEEQIRLNLSRPEYTPESDCIRALECRQYFDKAARDFIKKLKQRAY